MANYADYLSYFDYNVIFKSTKANANADYCSRAIPVCTNNQSLLTNEKVEREEEQYDDFDHFALCQIKQFPVQSEHIARETRRDPHLGKILQLLQEGKNLTNCEYKAPEAKYMLATNCLVFEHRIIIPPTLRQPILNDLHTAHLDIVKMKGIARSFVY